MSHIRKFAAFQIILTVIFFLTLNVQAQTPAISFFSSSSGPVGTLVTITNGIRNFAGKGTLVWGARTIVGKDND